MQEWIWLVHKYVWCKVSQKLPASSISFSVPSESSIEMLTSTMECMNTCIITIHTCLSAYAHVGKWPMTNWKENYICLCFVHAWAAFISFKLHCSTWERKQLAGLVLHNCVSSLLGMHFCWREGSSQNPACDGDSVGVSHVMETLCIKPIRSSFLHVCEQCSTRMHGIA